MATMQNIPPSKRGKKHLHHAKRIQISNIDGWTTVTSTRPTTKTTSARNIKSIPSNTKFHLTPLIEDNNPEISLEELEDEYKRCTSLWTSSGCYHQLQTILAPIIPKMEIDRCVIFGLGSLSSSASGGWQARRRSMYQLVALESMIRMISRCLFSTEDPL